MKSAESLCKVVVDTNIYAKAKNVKELFEKVNKGLQNLSKWFRCNKLTLNLKKTEFVFFGGPRGSLVPAEGLTIGGEQIRQVDGVRFLGVWVDEALRWVGQIEKVRAKVGRLVGVLGRAGSVVGRRCLQMLYNALVLPHLQYCLMVWGDFRENHNVTLGNSLLKLQKRLVGIIAGESGKFHSEPLFAELGILKIDDLYRHQLRVHAWKFWNNKLPENQTSMLCKVSDVHGYGTRSAGSGIFVGIQDHKSMSYKIPKEWESITRTHIRKCH